MTICQSRQQGNEKIMNKPTNRIAELKAQFRAQQLASAGKLHSLEDLSDYTEGTWLSGALDHLNQTARNLGRRLTKDEITTNITPFYEAWLETQPKHIPLFEEPVPYVINLGRTTKRAAKNYDEVIETFDLLARTPVVETGVIMPDACPSGSLGTIPVGGVIAARNAIIPGAHSADICCSLYASYLRAAPNIPVEYSQILDMAMKVTHFGPGGREPGTEHAMPHGMIQKFESNRFLNQPHILAAAKSDFATQGDGNHFFYLGKAKSSNQPVIITHHGSRRVGAYLYKIGHALADAHRLIHSPETPKVNAWIPFDSEDGHDYWEALQIVREWTKASHRVIHRTIAGLLRMQVIDQHFNEHNFVFHEKDNQGDLFWHAKGATPLHAPFLPDYDGRQIIPLNMASSVLIVRGTRTSSNMGFAPHGAGRELSRNQYRDETKEIDPKTLFDRETAHIDARAYTGIPDITELPSAYKSAEQVMTEIRQFDLAEIIDEIEPYGSIMAGETAHLRYQPDKV